MILQTVKITWHVRLAVTPCDCCDYALHSIGLSSQKFVDTRISIVWAIECGLCRHCSRLLCYAGEFHWLRCASSVGNMGRPRLPGLPTHPRHPGQQPSVVPEPDISERQWRRGRRSVTGGRVAFQRWRTSVEVDGQRHRCRLCLSSAEVRRWRDWRRRPACRHQPSLPTAASTRPSPVGPFLSQHRGLHRGRIWVAGCRGRLLTTAIRGADDPLFITMVHGIVIGNGVGTGSNATIRMTTTLETFYFVRIMLLTSTHLGSRYILFWSIVNFYTV